MVSPDRETILAAFRQDPAVGSERFIQLKEIAARLPEILADYLEQEVTPRRFLEVWYLVCQVAVQEDACKLEAAAASDALATLNAWRQNPTLVYEYLHTTETGFMFEHVGFTEALKQRFREGRLTFADVIREQPRILFF